MLVKEARIPESMKLGKDMGKLEKHTRESDRNNRFRKTKMWTTDQKNS